MQSMSLEFSLRSFFSGLLITVFFAIIRPVETKMLLDYWDGIWPAPTIAFVIGILFYSVYRPILYDKVIVRLLDCVHKNSPERNYRIWLSSRYNITPDRAETFYSSIRDEFTELASLPIRARSAQIHFAYQAAIISIIYGLVALGFSENPFVPRVPMFLGFSVLGILFGYAAYTSDSQIDRQVVDRLAREVLRVHRFAHRLRLQRRR
jgi:hypothetical protein